MNRPPPPSDKAREGLAAYRAGVSAAKRRDIEKAIRHLRKTGAAINVAAVAARAGVQRKTIYKHPDLIAAINQYRHHRTALRRTRPRNHPLTPRSRSAAVQQVTGRHTQRLGDIDEALIEQAPASMFDVDQHIARHTRR